MHNTLGRAWSLTEESARGPLQEACLGFNLSTDRGMEAWLQNL